MKRELEAVQTVGPPGIYDACRRTINANVPKAAPASRSVLGSFFGHFGRERKRSFPTACLSLGYPQVFKKLAFNHGKCTNIFLKSDVIWSWFCSLILGWNADERGSFPGDSSSHEPCTGGCA